MRDVLRGARAAFTFLTIIPVGGFPYSDGAWRWSAAWFPFVGAFLGLLGALGFAALRPAGVWVAAFGAVAITVFLTGAFHEDGLADSADALGGAYSREKLFEILKDSRVGTYGGLALVLSVGLRVAALASLDAWAPVALVLVHTLARTTPVWLMALIPYVTSSDASKSRPVIRGSHAQAIAGTAMAFALIALLEVESKVDWATAGWSTLALLVIALLLSRVFIKRAGGITGDFLGATEQCNEVTLLVLLAYVGLP
ncbi:MAG: adenosylcobinamide-GDP ribazoletransferase [Myxococcota bacterium]